MKIKLLFLFILFSTNRFFSQDSTFSKYIDNLGIAAGAWVPAENSKIGPQTLLGLNLRLKKNIHSLNLYADFIGLATKTKDTLRITNDTGISKCNKISGQQFTLTYGVDVFKKNKFTTTLEAGIGHSQLIAFNKTEKLSKKYNFITPGIHFKFYLSQTNCLSVLFNYYFTNYPNRTRYPEIKGNYFAVRIIFGSK